ncbi:hypothetical protein BD289DRAFT_443331 [Coniella lustricola]|uniref:Uncharacterized protein n=1 Tax=Coniella lustricola TaxID=2025994 RepID=A0A2T2ZX61_9PEZI|nr:hypothetical protein BD289DRAFT_443331 [Coniella lustricola]
MVDLNVNFPCPAATAATARGKVDKKQAVPVIPDPIPAETSPRNHTNLVPQRSGHEIDERPAREFRKRSTRRGRAPPPPPPHRLSHTLFLSPKHHAGNVRTRRWARSVARCTGGKSVPRDEPR